ncbi:MAG: hypothetical protein FVQ80_13340 [Planctomycetes bacterium]|nr:hypothetical protein [Planctomycetota bacterium]
MGRDRPFCLLGDRCSEESELAGEGPEDQVNLVHVDEALKLSEGCLGVRLVVTDDKPNRSG